jgi:hypothetical protein
MALYLFSKKCAADFIQDISLGCSDRNSLKRIHFYTAFPFHGNMSMHLCDFMAGSQGGDYRYVPLFPTAINPDLFD